MEKTRAIVDKLSTFVFKKLKIVVEFKIIAIKSIK